MLQTHVYGKVTTQATPPLTAARRKLILKRGGGGIDRNEQ